MTARLGMTKHWWGCNGTASPGRHQGRWVQGPPARQLPASPHQAGADHREVDGSSRLDQGRGRQVEAQAVSFLKKNWPLLALFVAVGVILTLLMLLDRAQDDAIASMMADRTVAKHRAAREAIITKYAILNAAKDQELITW